MARINVLLSVTLAAAVAGAAAGACGEYESCDQGQFLANYVCVPKPDAGPMAADDAGGTGCNAKMTAHAAASYGTTCTTADDCGCEANFCAAQPGSPTGFCTRTGCLKDPTVVCPEGWKCTDLSMYLPGLSMCLKN
jgi:hypothetical protein